MCLEFTKGKRRVYRRKQGGAGGNEGEGFEVTDDAVSWQLEGPLGQSCANFLQFNLLQLKCDGLNSREVERMLSFFPAAAHCYAAARIADR